MDPRTKDTLAWGAVGALAFLVLAQGFVLATSEHLGFARILGVAVVVFVVAAVASRAFERRFF
jgi:hypothetical protein